MIKDLVIIEIASVLAGPSVGMFFSELGASVTKIENKLSGGDITRSWKLPNESKQNNNSAYFSSVNYHKTHLFFNLKDKTDYDKTICLIKSADILIVNFKKGDDLKLGLDYQSLKQINPKLIYASINGFGADSDRVAYDLILQAETGFMSMNGTRNSGPIKMPVALIDVLAGHQLKEGILLALINRSKTNNGSKVEVSLYDSAIASLANQASNYLMANHIAQPLGSLHPNIAPYGELFETKDKYTITFAIGSNKQFKSLLEGLKLTEIKSDIRFIDNISRVKNREVLQKLLKSNINQFTKLDLLNYCHSHFIPAAEIKNMKAVFENKQSQNLILEETVNGQLTKRVKTVAFKITS